MRYYEVDSELVALAEIAAAAEHQSSMLELPYAEMSPQTPGYKGKKAAETAAREIMALHYHPALERAAALQARGQAGLQAKARLVLRHLDPDHPDVAIGISLARDVLNWRSWR